MIHPPQIESYQVNDRPRGGPARRGRARASAAALGRRSGAERRQFMRFHLRLPVEIEFPGGHCIKGETEELSLGNALVRVSEPVPTHGMVRLHLPHPRARLHPTLRMPGVTARLADGAIAIEFNGGGDELDQLLGELLGRMI